MLCMSRLLPFALLIVAVAIVAACGETEPELDAVPPPPAATIAPPSPTETSTPEPTPAPSPIPTNTPLPSPTATAIPAPTVEPTPLPTGTATPEPLTALGVLEGSAAAMLEVDSFHFEMAIDIGIETEGISMTLPVTMTGNFLAPDRISGVFGINLGFFAIESEIIGIGDTLYTKDPETGEWDVSTGQDALFASPEEFVGVDTEGLSNLVLIGEDVLDGSTVYVVEGTAAPGTLNEAQGETEVTYWVGVDDLLLRQIVAVGSVDSSEAGDSLLGDFGTGTSTASITLKLSDFGAEFSIEAPELTPTPEPSAMQPPSDGTGRIAAFRAVRVGGAGHIEPWEEVA